MRAMCFPNKISNFDNSSVFPFFLLLAKERCVCEWSSKNPLSRSMLHNSFYWRWHFNEFDSISNIRKCVTILLHVSFVQFIQLKKVSECFMRIKENHLRFLSCHSQRVQREKLSKNHFCHVASPCEWLFIRRSDVCVCALKSSKAPSRLFTECNQEKNHCEKKSNEINLKFGLNV